MSIGATYKDPRSGLFLKHIAGEIVFRRIGKGIVEVDVRHTYKLVSELAFSYKQPVHKWVKMSEANVVMEKLFKDAELALEPLTDLSPREEPFETHQIPGLDVPCTAEVHPETASCPLKSSPDSVGSSSSSSSVEQPVTDKE